MDSWQNPNVDASGVDVGQMRAQLTVTKRVRETLNQDHVDYVVVGEFAAVVRGLSLPTRDIDIVPARVSVWLALSVACVR